MSRDAPCATGDAPVPLRTFKYLYGASASDTASSPIARDAAACTVTSLPWSSYTSANVPPDAFDPWNVSTAAVHADGMMMAASERPVVSTSGDRLPALAMFTVCVKYAGANATRPYLSTVIGDKVPSDRSRSTKS
jgi:hypothetical protein